MNDSLISAFTPNDAPISFVIIGRNSLQTTIFARILEKQLGTRCFISSPSLQPDPVVPLKALALIDVTSFSNENIEQHLGDAHRKYFAMAIFNANNEIPLDWLLRWPKLKGIFFSDTTETQFVKGVEALCNNEYWLPRKILSDYLEKTRGTQPIITPICSSLTRKEIEILRAIASGASNTCIAQKLHISPHTVKTHIYNLYRKIKVSNRVQAVAWASLHLTQEVA